MLCVVAVSSILSAQHAARSSSKPSMDRGRGNDRDRDRDKDRSYTRGRDRDGRDKGSSLGKRAFDVSAPVVPLAAVA